MDLLVITFSGVAVVFSIVALVVSLARLDAGRKANHPAAPPAAAKRPATRKRHSGA